MVRREAISAMPKRHNNNTYDNLHNELFIQYAHLEALIYTTAMYEGTTSHNDHHDALRAVGADGVFHRHTTVVVHAVLLHHLLHGIVGPEAAAQRVHDRNTSDNIWKD